MLRVLVLTAIMVVLAILFVANIVARKCAEPTNEQNEEARKKLLEKEERDIELDGNE